MKYKLKGKKLLIMGGISAACDIVKQAKEMGLYVIVTDYIEDSPAKKIADESFMVSTVDVEAIVELCKEQQVDGVITGYIEFILPYYCEVCSRLNLPCYATMEQIVLTSNKRKFKAICRDNGIKVPRDYYLDDNFTEEDLKSITYPVIVKPADNGGIRGISICNNVSDLKNAHNKAMEYSKSKEIIIESYIKGQEVRIFYAVQDGESTLIALADREVVSFQDDIPPLPVFHSYPSRYLKKYKETTDDKIKSMIKSIGICNGFVFIQALVEKEEFVVFEMGFRLSGAREYHVTKLSGVNQLEILISYAVTGIMSDNIISESASPEFKDCGGIIEFLIRPGKISKIIGVKEVESLGCVVAVCPVYCEGDEIPVSSWGTLKQVALRVFVIVKNETKFEPICTKIRKTINIYSDSGEDMVIHQNQTKIS